MSIRKTYTGAGLLGMVLAVLILAVPARAEVVDRIVAVVNDSIITLSELDAAAAVAMDRLGRDRVEDEEKFRKTMLDSLIEQKLVKQAADRAGIEISEREIDNAIEDVRKKNNDMTEEQLKRALAASGLTYREYREQLKEQIRQVKFINQEFRSKISIQDEDVESYYRKHLDEFAAPATYRIRLIFLTADNGDPSERLRVVTGELENKEFSKVASMYSDAPSASSGGDLGYMKEGELSSFMKDIVKDLEPGETSGPVKTPEGVYILKLLDFRPSAPRPLEDVAGVIRDRLFNEIMDQRFKFWLEEQKDFAHIEVRL